MAKKTKELTYKWSSWIAKIHPHPRKKNQFKWWIEDADGNDTYQWYSHMDIDLNSLKEAENDMFHTINDHVGSEPKRQVT